jgi:ribosomal subunit interface protein
MTIQITGKNVDAGDAFKTYITDKISLALGKYIGPDVTGHIRLEKERNGFKTDCSIKIPSGLTLEARGEGGDAYASADAAIERLETRVRRHKRRIKGHHGVKGHGNEVPVADYTVRVDDDVHDEINGAANPVIIAESERGLRELPVSEAVMQLDLTESAFLVFRNAKHGGLNVVYRRNDGHIGWIDPKPGDGAANGVSS